MKEKIYSPIVETTVKTLNQNLQPHLNAYVVRIKQLAPKVNPTTTFTSA